MIKIKKILTDDNYLAVYLAIIFLFNILLLNLPLTNILGYEFSAFNSIFLVVISGIYTILTLGKSSTKELVIKTLRKSFSAFILIPFLIGIVNSLLVFSCSIYDGILFYIVITIPTVIIGGALGVLSYSISKKLSFLVFLGALIIVALIPFFEFYFYPQVYFYSPLLGFFPGTIYDEALSVNLKLVLYRSLNILFFGSLFYFLFRDIFKESILSKRVIITGAIIIPALFFFLSGNLGYNTPNNKLKSELNGRIETSHFVIHYSEQIDEKLIKVIALHHEFYYKDLSEFFKLNMKNKITSYIFFNAEQKGELFGSSNADVAKPWLRQIYTTYESYDRSLKHEIAHIFAGEFASGIFKVADGFNPALIEGIATAASPVYDENKIDYLTAVAYKNGYRVSIVNLFGFTSFFTSASSLSYIYAGAFTKYLIDKYGIDKFKIIYSTADFNKIYHKSLKSLETEFFAYLSAINSGNEEHTAHYYFGRKSIFQKVCPRYVADRTEESYKYYSRNNFNKSAEIFEELFRVSESYSPLSGWTSSLIKLKQLEKADSILTANIEKFNNTAYYYNLELLLADVSIQLNKNQRAESLYSKLIFQFPNRSLFYVAQLRMNLSSKGDLLKLYTEGNELDKYLIIRELNKSQYYYNSFPVLIDLSRSLNEDYEVFLRQFDHTIIVDSYASAYALYKLSNYMLENSDIDRARKMAGLSQRYSADENFDYLIEENYKKMDWFRNNAQGVLNTMKINK